MNKVNCDNLVCPNYFGCEEVCDSFISKNQEEKLITLLKTEYGSRVTLGHGWLVWDEIAGDNGMWVVYERLPYQKKTRILITTDNLQEALQVLSLDGE